MRHEWPPLICTEEDPDPRLLKHPERAGFGRQLLIRHVEIPKRSFWQWLKRQIYRR